LLAASGWLERRTTAIGDDKQHVFDKVLKEAWSCVRRVGKSQLELAEGRLAEDRSPRPCTASARADDPVDRAGLPADRVVLPASVKVRLRTSTSKTLPGLRPKNSTSCWMRRSSRFGGKSSLVTVKRTDIGVSNWSGLWKSYQASASWLRKLNGRSALSGRSSVSRLAADYSLPRLRNRTGARCAQRAAAGLQHRCYAECANYFRHSGYRQSG